MVVTKFAWHHVFDIHTHSRQWSEIYWDSCIMDTSNWVFIPSGLTSLTTQDIFVYMSCISKTTCFLVNCAPLSLQFGRNGEPKGSNGSRLSEYDYRTPPSKLDMAPFWHTKPQPIRGFPTIEPVTFRCRQ